MRVLKNCNKKAESCWSASARNCEPQALSLGKKSPLFLWQDNSAHDLFSVVKRHLPAQPGWEGGHEPMYSALASLSVLQYLGLFLKPCLKKAQINNYSIQSQIIPKYDK